MLSIPFLDTTRTPFPYRSFYVPVEQYVKQMKYNPYYVLRRVKRNEDVNIELPIKEDHIVLQSNEDYLNEDTEL